MEESGHIGGLTSGGLFHTDFVEAPGGTSRDVKSRVETPDRETHGPDRNSFASRSSDILRGPDHQMLPSAGARLDR